MNRRIKPFSERLDNFQIKTDILEGNLLKQTNTKNIFFEENNKLGEAQVTRLKTDYRMLLCSQLANKFKSSVFAFYWCQNTS